MVLISLSNISFAYNGSERVVFASFTAQTTSQLDHWHIFSRGDTKSIQAKRRNKYQSLVQNSRGMHTHGYGIV